MKTKSIIGLGLLGLAGMNYFNKENRIEKTHNSNSKVLILHTCDIGDDVEALWDFDGILYGATIVSVDGTTITVDWDDGDIRNRVINTHNVYKSGLRCGVVPTPPYNGTAIEKEFKNIIINSDPSSFESILYKEIRFRKMYDRRKDRSPTTKAFLYDAKFKDIPHLIEIQVNIEFEDTEANYIARKYAWLIGQFPAILLKNLYAVLIHKGNNLFAGIIDYGIVIYDEKGKEYENGGILEEILIHEASHTSLDLDHSTNNDWRIAQRRDGNFISDYARDNPIREDIAESFLAYIAITYRSDRISEKTKSIILKTIPNRINYFDNQKFDMSIYEIP